MFALDAAQAKQLLRTLRKLQGMDWPQIQADHGLKWEQIKGQPLYFTVRISQQSRLIATRAGTVLRFESLHFDHDSAYGKK
jgi:hypothetical protein